MTDLTKLTPSEIEERYQTRDGSLLKNVCRLNTGGLAAHVDGYEMRWDAQGNHCMQKDCADDLVLKPEYAAQEAFNTSPEELGEAAVKAAKDDEITDTEIIAWVKDNCVVIDRVAAQVIDVERLNLDFLSLHQIKKAIRAEREPKITHTWYVNHYADGWSGGSWKSRSLADDIADVDTMPHGPRTHIEKREVYDDGNVVVTKWAPS